MTTGTRTQVADTRSAGRPRILRDSLRIFSSSDDQPSAFTEPAHGTTFRASGAGNGPKSPTAARRSPARWPSDRVPGDLVHLARKACRSRPGRLPRRPGRRRPPAPQARTPGAGRPRHDQRQGGAVRVGDDALGPVGGCSGLTSGTTSGTSGSIRNAPELSTTTAPRAAATGAHCADTSSGTSNMATSTPSNDLLRRATHLGLRGRAPQLPPGRTRRGDQPDLAPDVLAGGQQVTA